MAKSSFGPLDHEKRSKLSHVRGTGASGFANKRWVVGKVTSILSIPLVVYGFVSLFFVDMSHSAPVIAWVSNPIHGAIVILGVALFVWHLMLLTEEAVHDYIDSPALVLVSLLLLRLFVLAGIVFVGLCVLMISLK